MVEKPAEAFTTSSRILSIDIVRGIVMILMALDHTRDYFSNIAYPPLDLAQTTIGLFLTRWVTHFCAPAFVLLAGASAFLWATARSKSRVELARFLLIRGLALIVLELTVVRFAWFFTLDYEVSMVQVIWAIGWSMIVLAALVFLPNWLILALASAMIAGHNLLDGIWPNSLGALGWMWAILHTGGLLTPLPGHQLLVQYPLIPWIGVMALGYGLGPLFLREKPERRKWLLVLGIGLTLGFVLIRLLNVYGDPFPWSAQQNSLLTFLSFINVEKYPPSLLYLLVTLGPVFVALALLDRPTSRVTKPIVALGEVPLFFYVIHLYLIHVLAVGLAVLHYGEAKWLFGANWLFRTGYPPDYGYGLVGVYLIWLAIVVALYPLCRWYASYKRLHKAWWLSYL